MRIQAIDLRTIPTFRLDLKRPRIGRSAGTSFFLGAISYALDCNWNECLGCSSRPSIRL